MAVKTITLTYAEVAVTGLDGAHTHISNMGVDIIYIVDLFLLFIINHTL